MIYIIWIVFFIFLFFVIKRLAHKIQNQLTFCISKNYEFDIELERNKLYKKFGNTITFDEINIKTSDNEIIGSLYLLNKSLKYHIIYAHGNAGTIYDRMHIFRKFGNIGSIILFDYRGYGKSTGYPTEQGVYKDIDSVWNYLINQGISPKNIVIYGESLGTAISAWLVNTLCKKKIYPKALIMQSGFSSAKDIACDLYIPKPISIFAKDEFNSKLNLQQINNKVPILIVHSKTDGFIDIKHAHKLMEYNKNCQFYEIEGSHGSPIINKKYITFLKDFINKN